jgi:hypothetical protein
LTAVLCPRCVALSAAQIEGQLNLEQGTIAKIANDLWQAKGKSIVFGGESLDLQLARRVVECDVGQRRRHG